MDAALSRSLRWVTVAVSSALAAKCRVEAEVEALKAFGTLQYGARVVQVFPCSTKRSIEHRRLHRDFLDGSKNA